MRIGILGVAHLHVDAYFDKLVVGETEVVGVYDRDAERGRSWAAQHGVVFFSEADRLLRSGLDGVIVCAETAFHGALIARAAEEGVAVLCEKPLGVSRQDTDAIVQTCDSAGVVLMPAFPMRFHPAVQRARQMVHAGELGRVRVLVGTNQGVIPPPERSWFTDKALAGGGAIMDHVVHLADVFCWVLGAVPDTVYALANRVMHPDLASVETGGVVVLNYGDGTFASIDCSWDRPARYPSFGEAGFRIVGDSASLVVDATSERLTVFGGEKTVAWRSFGPQLNQLMINEFLAAIREHRSPAVSGRDGQVATHVALSALASALTGELETLRLDPSPGPT